MIVARFGASTGWVGKTITYESGQFTLEDHGPITAADVLTYDGQGHLVWAYDGLREWVQQVAAATAAAPPPASLGAVDRAPEKRSSFPVWAGVLVGLGTLFFAFVPIVCAPMFLNQRDKAREAGVKEGMHAIQVGIQTWAVDHRDEYPAAADNDTLASYVRYWPTNPYTNTPMTEGRDPGEYTYVVSSDRTSFALIGYGEDGKVVMSIGDRSLVPAQ